MYGPSSSMVDDYTAERRKTERERERKVFVCFPHHLRPYNTEREKFCVRKKNVKIFEVCHNE